MKGGDRWEESGARWEGPDGIDYDDLIAQLRQIWEDWKAQGIIGPNAILGETDAMEPPVSDPKERRSTVETVIVHHFMPRSQFTWHGGDLDSVNPRAHECSLPLNLSVIEDGALFHVEEIPTECPLCKRAFSGWDMKRISEAAILNYTKRELHAAFPNRQPKVHPIDVVFDV